MFFKLTVLDGDLGAGAVSSTGSADSSTSIDTIAGSKTGGVSGTVDGPGSDTIDGPGSDTIGGGGTVEGGKADGMEEDDFE